MTSNPRTDTKAVTASTAASLTGRPGQAMLLVAADAAVRRDMIRNNNGQSAGLSGAAAMSSAMNSSGSALKSRVGANRNRHATRRMLGRCDGMAWVHH